MAILGGGALCRQLDSDELMRVGSQDETFHHRLPITSLSHTPDKPGAEGRVPP